MKSRYSLEIRGTDTDWTDFGTYSQKPFQKDI